MDLPSETRRHEKAPTTFARSIALVLHTLCLLRPLVKIGAVSDSYGGGIRGLSPLLMLKEIMHRIQQNNHLSELPRPCDVFDLAGGTSTGGLIVIMLFRLRMEIDDAIKAYVDLSRGIFSEKKRWFQDGTFKARRLEEAILSVISSRLPKPDTDPVPEPNTDPLLAPDTDPRGVKMLYEEGPKCFVCAMQADNMAAPVLFRSWKPKKNPSFDCTIVQAARATTAAPTFFKAAKFGDPTPQRYLDGGLRCNNPVEYVVEEARSLYPGRPFSCILSLGTGEANVIGLERPDAFQNMLPTKLIRVLQSIATDCERKSEEMEKQLNKKGKPDSYFRLNVIAGLQNISLAEWDQLPRVETHTDQYLKKFGTGRKVDQVVELLEAFLVV